MPTGYKYVERDAQDTQINWAEVGANFSGMLQEEVRVREEKKDALDKLSRDYQNSLSAVPQGQNTKLNENTLNFTGDAQEVSLMANKNLKDGLLSPRDFTIMMQNLKDGTTQAFSLFEEYNQEYSKKMKAVEDGTISQMGLDVMADTESFSNFKKHRFLVNPDTGVVGVAKMVPKGPDGALVPDTKNTFPPNVLSNRIKQNINIYNVAEASKRWVDKLGSNEIAVIGSRGTALQAGIIEKIEDIRIREGGLKGKSPEELEKIAKDLGVSVEDLNVTSLFLQAQDKWIDSEISSVVNSLAAGSVLIDYMGKTIDNTPYTSTLDESKIFNKDGSRNESVILLSDVDGRVIANLTDAQKENAKRTMRDISDIQVKTKYDMQPSFFEKQRLKDKSPRVYIDNSDKEAAKARRAKLNKYNQMANEFAKFWYGTEDEKNRAANYFGGLGDNKEKIKEINPRPKGLEVKYTDGSTKIIKALDSSNKPMDKESFFASYFNYLLPGGYTEFTLDDISEFSDKENEEYTFTSADGSKKTPEYTPKQQAKREFNDYVDASLVGKEGINYGNSLSSLVNNLKARFAQAGLDFEPNDNDLDIIFTFIDNEGTEQERKARIEIDGQNATNARQKIARKIKEVTDASLIESRGYKTKKGIKRYEAYMNRKADTATGNAPTR